MDTGEVVPQKIPAIGEDVSDRMPAVGADVSHLMGDDRTKKGGKPTQGGWLDAAMGVLNAIPGIPHPEDLKKLAEWLPTVGAGVGGVVAGIPGAAVGGAAGEGMRSTLSHVAELPGAVVDVARNVVAHPRETFQGFMEGAAQGATQAATSATEQAAYQATGSGLVKLGGYVAPKLMQSAVKPAYKMVEKAVKKVEIPRVVQTLLKEGVPVTQSGIGKINSLLASTNDEIAEVIAKSTAKVYPEAVADAAQGVITQAGKQVAPVADQAAAEGVVDQFMRVHGGAMRPATPLTVAEAQALKQGTYKAIGSRAYGETQGAALEAEKALARGLKEGIETAHPSVKGLNAREGALIEARDAIAKRVGLAANRDPGGIGWIAENPKSFLAFLLARSPAVKSMIANGMYKSVQHATGVPENLIRFGVEALASSGEDE